MPLQSSFGPGLAGNPRFLLLLAATLTVLVRWLDLVVPDLSFGVLYVLPILPAALVLNRWQIGGFAVVLAVVRALSLPWDAGVDSFLRFLLALSAYLATGLLVSELVRNQKLVLRHSREMQQEQQRREEIESYLAQLAESSPAAIFTLDEQGRVLLGNRAAAELAGASSPETLRGLPIGNILPPLADALKFAPGTPSFRTSVQCQGRRLNGSLFLAQTWFSTYQTSAGNRLAAIAVDISEEIREREEQNLRQLLTNNRILAAAVSHEIRNLCGAVLPVYGRLEKVPGLAAQEDFVLLGQMVEALGRISAHDLQKQRQQQASRADLSEVISHLTVIAEPNWSETRGAIRWILPPEMPVVQGESYGILQVLMNLEQNARRATDGLPHPELTVAVESSGGWARIAVSDNGPGVARPKDLFEPFHSGGGGSGLGLYVSRAISRGYGGDLRYVAGTAGACFVLELPVLQRKET